MGANARIERMWGLAVVVEAGPCSWEEFLGRVVGSGRGEMPFSFTVCPGGFAMTHSHELGDGSVSAALLEAVLTAYAGAGAARPVPGRIARDRDLMRALASLWLRRPRTVLGTAAGVLRRHRRRPAPANAARSGVAGVRHETWEVDAGQVAELDRWRRTLPERPSMSMTLLWVVARALAANGYPAGPQPWQVVAGMRGAPELSGLGGNLVGRALVVLDPEAGPEDAAAQLRRQSCSGEIVALHLLKVGLRRVADGARRLRRSPAAPLDHARIGTSPGLSWSDRSRHAHEPGFGSVIPSVAADGSTVLPYPYVFVSPGLAGIAANVSWVGDRAGVLLSFGASPLDDAAVDGVLRTLRGAGSDCVARGRNATHLIESGPGAPVGGSRSAESARC